MNQSDSERIATLLEKVGYQKASNKKEADLILVNMCSVRQSAVDRVYGLVKNFEKMKKENPNLKTALTGCILQKDLKNFKKSFDLIFEKRENLEKFFGISPKRDFQFSVKIPISFGCNNFCSYCVVPFTRGPLFCREPEEILKEVKEAVKNGAKEIWLLGQNVNDYKVENFDFSRLLKEVHQIEGDFWLRFTSPNPKDFDEELIETMAKLKKVTPYLNLPLQSGDNEILKKMRRQYTVEEYEKLVKKIKRAFSKYREGLEKDPTISTDIIVGFPGEGEKNFENTVKIFKKIKFDMAYIAKYSKRPQTLAFQLEETVSKEEKERRWKILNSILKEIALERNKRFLGKEVEVLVNEIQKKEGKIFCLSKSRHYKTVKFEGREEFLGNFLKVKITEIFPWGLKGEIS